MRPSQHQAFVEGLKALKTAKICKVVHGGNINSSSSGYIEMLDTSAGRELKVDLIVQTMVSVNLPPAYFAFCSGSRVDGMNPYCT